MRELVVVASHWDEDQAEQLCKSLLGEYKAIINGETVQTRVVDVLPVLESQGTYHLLKDQLDEGDTLVYELGFGTTERFFIDGDGNFFGSDPYEKLAVKTLARDIANDSAMAPLRQKDSQSVSLSVISNGLRDGSIPRVKANTWTKISNKYIATWLEKLHETLMSDPNASLADNWVLTGGGAAIAKPFLQHICLIPEEPQTASVRGAYNLLLEHHKVSAHA